MPGLVVSRFIYRVDLEGPEMVFRPLNEEDVERDTLENQIRDISDILGIEELEFGL